MSLSVDTREGYAGRSGAGGDTGDRPGAGQLQVRKAVETQNVSGLRDGGRHRAKREAPRIAEASADREQGRHAGAVDEAQARAVQHEIVALANLAGQRVGELIDVREVDL